MQEHHRRNMENTIRAVRSGTPAQVQLDAAMAEPDYLAQLAAAIREGGDVRAFHMEWNERSASEYGPLLEALATCDSLLSLRLDGNWIGDRHAGMVAEVLRANPRLTHVSLRDTGLTARGCATIAAAVTDCLSLREFAISDNGIGAAGAQALAQTLFPLPALRLFAARGCDIDDSGIAHIAQALRDGQDTVVECDLRDNPASAGSGEMLLEAITASDRRNLCYAPLTGYNPLALHCNRNYTQAQEAKRILEDCASHDTLPYADLLSAEIATIQRYKPALEQYVFEDVIGQFEDFLARDLPPVPARLPADWQSLTARNGKGLCLLDHPRTWQRIGEVFAAAQTAGTPVTTDMLAQRNHNGECFLAMGMAFAPENLLPVLHRHGIRLQKAALIAPDGEATPLLKSMTMLETVPQLFTEANWQGASAQTLRETFHALPEAAQAQVGNLHSLAARLEQQRPQAQRGR